ncbi:antigen 5 like allergen Cul n 1 [Drosophila guanche]|uniref:Blast:Venom allergen 5 n=1 Tax=Drosophila guanche TaxID=7266 RepID=A0A3B0J6X5_DROGU|nr:antigen 5 like allergen Cul n 1 [Drosophila guanche]SPP75602.1 blast:Venom allergen 5 [Drosophila guanche]
MRFKLRIAVCLMLISNEVGSTDYCRKDLCPPLSRHIGCENYGVCPRGIYGFFGKDFHESCGTGAVILQFPMHLQAQLLSSLNSFRNAIALGRYPPFRPAARMSTLRWSEELAGLAKFALRGCDNLQEHCSNTNEFKYVSYIYGRTRWQHNAKTAHSVVQYVLQFWMDDHKRCTIDHINAIRPPKDGKCRGYFTQLVQDHAEHIGCALMERRTGNGSGQYSYGLLCQFSRGKIFSQRVYVESVHPGEWCFSGANANYQGLCSLEELINPNAVQLDTLHLPQSVTGAE